MALADPSYVREHDSTLYVGMTRVTVHSLVAAWRNEGYSAEELQLGFPALSLAQVYGTIAYYLDHQQNLDARFAAEDQEYYRQRALAQEADPDFYHQLDARKAALRMRLSTPDSLLGSDKPGATEVQ
ncbi:MAG: DUF433 domain-containing protein [Nitrososphaerota archaeon]